MPGFTFHITDFFFFYAHQPSMRFNYRSFNTTPCLTSQYSWVLQSWICLRTLPGNKFGTGGRGWVSRRVHRTAWGLGLGIDGLELNGAATAGSIRWTKGWAQVESATAAVNWSGGSRLGLGAAASSLQWGGGGVCTSFWSQDAHAGEDTGAMLVSLITHEEESLPPVKGHTGFAYLIPSWGIEHYWNMSSFLPCIFCIS